MVQQSRCTAHRLASLFLTGLLGIGYESHGDADAEPDPQKIPSTPSPLCYRSICSAPRWAPLLHNRYAPFRAREHERDGWFAAATSLACVCGTVGRPGLCGCGRWQFLARKPCRIRWPARSPPNSQLQRPFLSSWCPRSPWARCSTRANAQQSRDASGSLGPALAANTAGAALAPILFGPVLLPLLGAKNAFILIALAYACVALRRDMKGEWAPRLVAVAAALVLFLLPLSLRFIQVPAGGELLWHRDGVMASVSVVRDGAGDNYAGDQQPFPHGRHRLNPLRLSRGGYSSLAASKSPARAFPGAGHRHDDFSGGRSSRPDRGRRRAGARGGGVLCAV